MSFQYWQNTGRKRKTGFLSLDMAYHGDTVGAMSVSGVDLFNKKFEPLFFKTFKVPTPYCYRCPVGTKKGECAVECLHRVEEVLRDNADEISAIVIEPVLMGAAGMIIYPVEYLKGIWELSRKYNVHFIADEVATGFGRTGKMFACEHAGIEPDFMCLSKGITSGYLPIGATLTTDRIFKAFYGDYGELKTFYHGHTFTGNPLSCAAAVASIDLFEQENTLGRVAEISDRLGTFLREISELPIAGDVRGIGVVGAIELVRDKKTRESFGIKRRIALEVYKKGLEKGLLLRPLGDVVYLFLPSCIKRDELDDVLRRTADVVRSVTQK
jgi:adenosylmethionine-8-amino-7-oxononanoate aminotransferase